VAALKVAKGLGPDDVVVVLLPDGGRGYLGKIFNETWMSHHGFTAPKDRPTVRDVLDGTAGTGRELLHVRPTDSVADAVRLMHERGVDQLLVLTAPLPVVLGEVAGTVDGRALLDAVLRGEVSMTDPVGNVVQPLWPLVGINESVSSARELLTDADALLVMESGKPEAVLTRSDLLTFLAEER
jgi:cystathionine beta-synthase